MAFNPDYFRTDPATTGFYLQHQHTTLILPFHSVNIFTFILYINCFPDGVHFLYYFGFLPVSILCLWKCLF